MLCKYCGEEQSIEEFEIANIINGIEYRRKKCKTCKREQQDNRVRQIKEWVTEYKKKLLCNRCGFSDFRALQFHHTNPEEKDFSISNAVRLGYSIERILKEISKCEVLCANCHFIEHYQGVV